MTLGEFREITRGLPDDAEFVDANGEQCDYLISVMQEYGTYDTSKDRTCGPPTLTNCTISVTQE